MELLEELDLVDLQGRRPSINRYVVCQPKTVKRRRREMQIRDAQLQGILCFEKARSKVHAKVLRKNVNIFKSEDPLYVSFPHRP